MLSVALDQRDTRFTDCCPRRQTQQKHRRESAGSPETPSRTKLHEVLGPRAQSIPRTRFAQDSVSHECGRVELSTRGNFVQSGAHVTAPQLCRRPT